MRFSLKLCLMSLILMPFFVVASEPLTVPVLQPDQWFSKQKELSTKELDALLRSKSWIEDQRYPYREGNKVMYLYEGGQASLVCAPLKLCLIELEAGERIVKDGLHLGDRARWKITPTVGGDQKTLLVVKPVDVGLETSLAFVTDRRVYHIKLISRKTDYMPIIAFEYAENIDTQWEDYYKQVEQESIKVEQAEHRETIPKTRHKLSDLDFDYELTGCRRCLWKPERVYNNGEQTFIQMGKGLAKVDAPVLLVMNNTGESLVNYRVIENKYIVDQVFQEAILISGVGKHQDRLTIRRVTQ